MTNTTTKTITTNSLVRITKGCKALGIKQGYYANVIDVAERPEYGGLVRLVLCIHRKNYVFWARHKNRLTLRSDDAQVRLNNGDPTKVVIITLA